VVTPTDVILFAAETGPGRGENPSESGGVLLIVGIALVVIALFAVGLWALSRRGASGV
jgi:hypothetical protein